MTPAFNTTPAAANDTKDTNDSIGAATSTPSSPASSALESATSTSTPPSTPTSTPAPVSVTVATTAPDTTVVTAAAAGHALDEMAATAAPTAPLSAAACPTAYTSPSVAVAEGGLLDAAAFSRDVSIPDCTFIAPGASFTKTWEIRNTGTTTWDSHYHWRFEAGAPLGPTREVTVPNSVPPGGTVRFSVSMTAPTRARGYIGYWQMTNPAGAVFGQQAWVDIIAGTPPPATPTPLPGTPSTTPTVTSTPTTIPSPSATPPRGGGEARPPTPTGTRQPASVPWFGPAVGRAFLAEGYTGSGYQEYLSLLNPHTKTLRVQITINRSDGATRILGLRLAPLARQSLNINLLAPRASVSLKIEADASLVAERALYSGQNGSIVAGAPLPDEHWYSSEAYVGSDFADGLRVYNPYDIAAPITLTAYLSDGAARVSHRLVAGSTRLNVSLDDVAPTGGSALRVDSALPVVVESVVRAAHTSGPTGAMAFTAPSRRWYFTDGGTQNGDKEYISIFNPDPKRAALATLRFVTADGYQAPLTIRARPHARAVFVIQGLIHQSGVAAEVDANRPVVAQEIRYMRRGGVALFDGAARPARSWALADGYAGHGFKEWITLLNPNKRAVTAKVRLIGRNGPLRTVTVREKPRSRDFLGLDTILPNGPVSALVDANSPIVVGRTLLFNGDKGLSTSVGIALR